MAGTWNGFYCVVNIAGRRIGAHRIAWVLSHGKWPDGVVDHLNGDTRDNRLANLRDTTPRVNCENQRRAHSRNPTGLLGVRQSGSRYSALITVRGRCQYLGSFGSPEEAHEAYLTAKRELHEGCTL